MSGITDIGTFFYNYYSSFWGQFTQSQGHEKISLSAVTDLYSYFRGIGKIGQNQRPSLQDVCTAVATRLKSESLAGALNFDLTCRSVTEEKKKIDFVIKVLENIQSQRDLSFEYLQLINRMLTIYENAQENLLTSNIRSIFGTAQENLSQEISDAVSAAKTHYFKTGTFYESNKMLLRLGCSSWQLLPMDVMSKIISFLSIRDHFRAAATCSSWHKAAYRPDALVQEFLPIGEETPYISSLTHRVSLAEIRAQQQLMLEATKNEPSDTLLLCTSKGDNPIFYKRGENDPLIVRCKSCFYVVKDNCRLKIAHEFKVNYSLLSVPSINKIFVVNQDTTRIHSIHEVDLNTAVTKTLYTKPKINGTINEMGYRNNKLWMRRRQDLFTLDLTTHQLEPSARMPKAATGLSHYKNMLRIFTSPGLVHTFETEDLTDPDAGSHPIPNTQDTDRFTTITDKVLYASYASLQKITAFDRTTGTKLKDYPHPRLAFGWWTPGAIISEGFLYLSPNLTQTEAYDLLTGKHIRSIPCEASGNESEMQAVANKIVYIRGNEVRAITLGKKASE